MVEPTGAGEEGGAVRAGVVPAASACELLLDLGREKATGVLEVYAEGRVRRFALRCGVPIHAHAGAIAWRLGDVVEHLGLPVKGGAAAALRGAIGLGPARRTGDALVQRGLLSRSSVERALREQLRLRAQELLRLKEGRYRFYAGAAALRGEPRQPDRWTPADLVAAVRRSDGRHEELRWILRRLEAVDPREALDLPPRAGAAEARAAFRRIAREHHPDRLQAVADPIALALHRRVFAAALRAWQRLDGAVTR
jgi:hypothetical protein